MPSQEIKRPRSASLDDPTNKPTKPQKQPERTSQISAGEKAAERKRPAPEVESKPPSRGVKRSLPLEDESNQSPRPRKRPDPTVHKNSVSQKQGAKEEAPKTPSQDPQKASQGLKRSFPADDDSKESPRVRKRPGGASRISTVDKEAVLKRQQEREEQARKEAATRGVHDVVKQHYNTVLQRGRDWRKTDSRIKGLRSFNNWVKSVIIHKFSPTDDGNGPPLRVLDLGCGKGGDLGKWQQAPQPVELLVGIDPAEVSIEQARERHAQLGRGASRGGRGGRGGARPQRTFAAEFIAQDAFGQTIANIPIVRHIGFEPGVPGSRRGGGGFDVVSLMFCMHYAFESEAKTRGMLQNVAGSLVKGGRFIGTIPNSDVIRSEVEAFQKRQENIRKHKDSETPPIPSNRESAIIRKADVRSSPIDAEPKGPDINSSTEISDTKGVNDNPSLERGGSKEVNIKPSSETTKTAEINGQPCPTTPLVNAIASKPPIKALPTLGSEAELLPVAEWGNSIYRVRFPGPTPKDGVFRPPFGWKYSYFMEEAVEEIPEYVVPWEAFRA